MNQHYELWSKAGVNPNWKIENPAAYLENFNWVSNWLSSYFFNKVSDFILGLVLMLIFVLFILKNVLFNKQKFDKSLIIYLIFFLILFIIWFLEFPQLRYSGYSIVANLFFLSFCFILSKFKYSKIFLKKFTILVFIGFFIFFIRNINRISNEITIYDYKIFTKPFFKIENDKFETKVFEENIFLNKAKNTCWAIAQPCTHRDAVKAKKWGSYIIYYE